MSVATYTVDEIVGSSEWDGGADPSRATTYWTFRQLGDTQEYEIGRKPNNPLKVGESFEAEAKGEKYGKIKLRRVSQQSFGDGSRSNGGQREFKADPAKQRAIIRQSAQKAAIEYAALQYERGKLPDNFKVADLTPVINFFYEDAVGAMEQSPIAPPNTDNW